MNRMLETVVSSSRGTGRLARLETTELIAKTGTTQDWGDLWFVGATPEYVTGLWIGHDILKQIDTDACYGSSQMWKNVFGDIADNAELKEFSSVNSVVRREFCTETGLIAGSNCEKTSTGYYKRTNIPATCSGEHIVDPTIILDDSVIVAEGVDTLHYETLTGNHYNYIYDLYRRH